MAGGRARQVAAELLERDDELARIDEAIAASVAGEGRFLVIEGRSGEEQNLPKIQGGEILDVDVETAACRST